MNNTTKKVIQVEIEHLKRLVETEKQTDTDNFCEMWEWEIEELEKSLKESTK
jgi:hypothetical protein